jgi:predicted DNA-binding ribbon-helix-helix protein
MGKECVETRSLTLSGVGRTTVQLEPEAWALVDSIAAIREQGWRAWVEDAMHLRKPDDVSSRAAWLRTCAMKQFREIAMRNGLELVAQQRANAIAEGDPFANPEFDSILGFLDDERLEEHLNECPVEGATDLGGFVLHVGFDEFQRRCFWIENRLKGGMSIVVSIPSPEQTS